MTFADLPERPLGNPKWDVVFLRSRLGLVKEEIEAILQRSEETRKRLEAARKVRPETLHIPVDRF